MSTEVETTGRDAVLVEDAALIRMMGLPVLEALPARGVPYELSDPFILVHDRRAALDGPRYRALVEHVTHDDVGDLQPQRAQGRGHLLRPAHQQPHVVPGTHDRGGGVGTHQAGTTGNQDLHAAMMPKPNPTPPTTRAAVRSNVHNRPA